MRLDICHLSAMITRWPCLKEKDKCLVRRFYKRCIGKASQISNLEDLSYFIELILVVSFSKCIESSINEPLPSVERLRFLNDKIKGVPLRNDDDDEEETNAETDGEGEFDSRWCTLQSYLNDAQNSTINDSNYVSDSSKVISNITYEENLTTDEKYPS